MQYFGLNPLRGRSSIKTGSLIVVWDHLENQAVFSGQILRMTDRGAFGRNYVQDPNSGKFSSDTTLDLEKCGLVLPFKTSLSANVRFRTYALPKNLGAADYRSFGIRYKIPYQPRNVRRKEAKPLPHNTLPEIQYQL